ncbi:hypothetical protein CBR_g46267 [Chara braunii]|uniref:Peptidase A2 domain-containing protein n=1 Tax=Chara braunii TaxID=69332 RepID=A0A388K448_CHABU|nr:hypothetical protein CBR_g46267 [Chara braunii]|eukprot:GBG64723.1 hypothetical protein CBR_g46267 [Chara braunii]
MDLEFRGTVEARGWVYLSQDGENAMVIELALGNTPDELFRKAEAEVVWAACQRREMKMERIDMRVELGDRGSMRRPVRTMRCVLPPFLVEAVFETWSRLVRICQSITNLGLYQCARQDFFRLSVEMGPFEGNWADELTEILNCLSIDNVFVSSSVNWEIVYRNVAIGETFLEGVRELFYDEEDDFKLGKMATEDETDNRKSEGGPGLGGSAVHSTEGQKDRESINPDGTKGNRKEISLGESSGKVGGSRQGTQETKEGRNKDRTSPWNSEGAVLKKTEEEKMDHLGQHVSLSLGRDIMGIVAARRSWKETRDVMMRKYLAAEKMATETDLAAVQRKNFATYNDFLRELTLVALRILGVMDRIMSKYFLRQFSEFDKDKILSAYQQTSKFVNTRDVDFSTVTDLAEKTIVTETLALLKEGEVIDLTGKIGDKVKKGTESLHERVHGVDNKIERVENALLVMQAQVSRPALPPQEAVVPPGVANRGFGRRDPANEQCRYCTGMGYYVRAWVMRRAVIMLHGLAIAAVEAEPVVEIIRDQLRGRGPQVNFILENDGRDKVNATTRLGMVGKRIIRDTVMEEVVGSSIPQAEPEAGEPEKVYGKPREEEPTDKVTAAKKKFRYQIPILSIPEVDDTLSKLLGTMVSVSFQTMLQASPRLLKGLRQLLTRLQVEIDENPEAPKEEREEEPTYEVANLQRSRGDLEDLEKAFADIRLSLPDREGSEVMRAPPRTKLSFHVLPVRKLKIQIGTHHTDALVDGGAEITLIRRDFTTITGYTVNKEVTGSIRGAGGEIPFAGYVTKCAIKAGVRESIWSFQRITVMEEMDHDIILGRPWCANVEMIGMHLHDGSYMVDIEDPVTGRGELLRLLGTGGDPPKGKLATWSPSFEDSTRKGAFARMEGMRERVEIMIEEAFNKKEWIKMGLPQKKRRQEDEVLGVMVAEKESKVELGVSLPKRKEVRMDVPEVALEIPDLLQLIKALRYHKVGVDSATLAKSEGEVQKGYCLNGKLVRYDQLPLDVHDRPYTVMQVTPMGFTKAVAEAQRKMLVIAGDMFPEKCEAYIDDNLIKGAQEKDETEVQSKIRRFVWDHLQDIKDLLRRFLVYNITASGPKRILGVPEVTILGFRCGAYGRKPDPAKTDKISQWPTPLRTTTEFDYKIERIAGIRNKADGLSRVHITPEGVEDAEPIDSFLEFEGETFAVDNEMMGEECVSRELLIQTLAKGVPAVVAKLREGPVTTRGRKEERDSWGAIVGPKEELIAMAVEGGRKAVMSLVESWEKKELQLMVNQMQERKDEDHEGREFFYAQIYEGIFREIGLLLVGNKQPTEVSAKAREEAERYVLRGGHLFRKEEGAMPRRAVCGRSRQLDVIQAMHDGLAGGHRSSKGTLAKIAPLYYWPGMAGMVAIYCQTCLICQERSSARVFEPLRPTRVLGPGHLVHLDLAVMPVSTDGYMYILDARDNLSGFVEAVALKKKTGRSVAD